MPFFKKPSNFVVVETENNQDLAKQSQYSELSAFLFCQTRPKLQLQIIRV